MNYTYLLRCADGTLYCGWTNHLAARVAAHNAGKGAKYTKARRPVVLAYYEEYATRSEAIDVYKRQELFCAGEGTSAKLYYFLHDVLCSFLK